MPFRVFALPATGDESAEAVLNGFLRSHRVLAVRRRFVDVGRDSFWSVCVDYLESTAGFPSGPVSGRTHVDGTRASALSQSFRFSGRFRPDRRSVFWIDQFSH